MISIATGEVVHEPGDLVTWHGYDAVVLDVDFERQYPYRIEIQNVTGQHFPVQAKAAEVSSRVPGSKRYMSPLQLALSEVFREDQERETREAEADHADCYVRSALVQTELELQAIKNLGWLAMSATLLIGFICGYLARR